MESVVLIWGLGRCWGESDEVFGGEEAKEVTKDGFGFLFFEDCEGWDEARVDAVDAREGSGGGCDFFSDVEGGLEGILVDFFRDIFGNLFVPDDFDFGGVEGMSLVFVVDKGNSNQPGFGERGALEDRGELEIVE